MDRSQAIRSQFAPVADRYAASSYHSQSPDLAAMLEAVALRGDERVLDVGTGAGHTAVAFAPRVAEVVALDLTREMLDRARELAAERGAANVRFELGDAMALPYPDQSFDCVTCRVCAHHFADPQAAVREAARVLRPGGNLLLVDSISPEDPAQDTFLNTIELLRDPSHVRNHRVSEWRAMFAEAGRELHEETVWSVPLDFDDWVARMQTPPPTCTQLKTLFRDATDAIRERFALKTQDPWGFSIPIALMLG